MADDMDIDMDFDPEIQRFQEEAAQLSAMPEVAQSEPEAMVEEGEVAGDDIAGNKVNISGVDELSSQDIQNFAYDHYKSRFKLQWVHDSSANLVYESNEAAAEALQAFSAESTEDPLQERRAVELATHPHVALYVRMAKNTDVKEQGAADQSRYYLMHPKEDPTSRPRGRPQRGGRRGGGRRGGGHEDRRMSREESTFDVGLYDDDPDAKAATAKRRMSRHSEDDLFTGRNKIRRVSGRGGDLMTDQREGRLRNRSASPVRDGDGRFGFNDDQPYRKTARRRSPPPHARSRQENYAAGEHLKKELFPSKKTGTALTNGYVETKKAVELFPPRGPPQVQDLFPDKVNHRRQEAKDLGPDEVASAIGSIDFSYQRDPPTYNQPGRRPENGRERNGAGKKDLFDRIGPSSGRLNARPSSEGNDGGFSIRGAGQSQGFSFKGASRDTPPVKELFPGKADLKPDLFPHKMQGRGGQRKLAEDDFS